MSSENQAVPQKESKKIHHTHFPVVKIPLKDDGHESAYEWIPSGNGRLKRVPKIPEAAKPKNLASLNH